MGSGIDKLTANEEVPLKSVQECVLKLQCNPPSISCSLGECAMCGDDEILKDQLKQVFHENEIDSISFKRWAHTDRSNLETVKKGTED